MDTDIDIDIDTDINIHSHRRRHRLDIDINRDIYRAIDIDIETNADILTLFLIKLCLNYVNKHLQLSQVYRRSFINHMFSLTMALNMPKHVVLLLETNIFNILKIGLQTVAVCRHRIQRVNL